MKKKEKRADTSASVASLDVSAGVPGFAIVGIGASAGGLEAVTTLLHSLPVNTGMAFVIVQHLAPRHASVLTEILSKTTSMRVCEVRDAMRVEPDTVYVITPGSDLAIERGKLRLISRSETRHPPRLIDNFLKSLAVDAQALSVGVILSGTGSDGTLGLKSINEEGGITFAQDVTAAHHGMPDSAVASGCVDFVLPPDQIAAELVRIAGRSSLSAQDADRAPPSAAAPPREDGFAAILQTVSASTAIDFLHYKHPTVRRRIERRMVLRRLPSLNAYLNCLRSDAREVQALCQEMLVQVTDFFRDPEVFEALKTTVFPKLFGNRSTDETIRIWVPGCATGEEVYSLAICLLEYLGERAGGQGIKIFATDISDAAVEKARAGIYHQSLLADVSDERIRQYFTKVDGGYRIAKRVRDLCIFARQDLAKDPPFSQLDLISCRNVLIYFDASLQSRVIPVFHYALRPGAVLMLGRSELIGPSAELFDPFDKAHHFYRRTDAVNHLTFHQGRTSGAGTALSISEAVGESQHRLQDILREADRVVLSKYAPAGVVVDEWLEIVQFRGHTGACLESAPGAPGHNLLQMAREGLLPELGEAVEAAKHSQVCERRSAVRVKTDGDFLQFDVEVIPISVPSSNRRFFVVLFEETAAADMAGANPAQLKASMPRKRMKAEEQRAESERAAEIARLAQELSATRAHLQSLIEIKEVGNEELRAANEEIVSSNEELQSVNEELETAKEELQAANEELATVNDELQVRIRQATQINDDLSNLIDSINIPIVMLGRDLRLRRFSPSAQQILNLRSGDIGRRISDFKPKINVPDLVPFIDRVLETLVTEEWEVTGDDGRWYMMSIRPYRTGADKIDGATLSMVDIDALKRNEQQIAKARDFARGVNEALRGPLLVLDSKQRVQFANRSFFNLFQLAQEETENQLVFALGGGQLDIPPLRNLIDRIAAHPESVRDFRIKGEFPKIGPKILMINTSTLGTRGSDGQASLTLISIEDVTSREHAEQEARDAAARMQAVIERATEAMVTFDDEGKILSFNKAGENMFGYAAYEIFEKPLSLLWVESAREEFLAGLKQYVQTGEDAMFRAGEVIFARRRDGSSFPADVSINRAATAGAPLFIAILQDVSERRALEREVLETSLYEQQRIGQDLHDSAGQTLSGLSYLVRGLAEGLKEKSAPEAETASMVVNELERVVEQLRRIMRGLVPVDVDSQGLMAALDRLAGRITETSGIPCRFECPRPVLVNDNQTALQLFLVAQEAAGNAVKHGRPRNVGINLSERGNQLQLVIDDDGMGINAQQPHDGMGLNIMNYRAGLLGGNFRVERKAGGGTRVVCLIPWNRQYDVQKHDGSQS